MGGSLLLIGCKGRKTATLFVSAPYQTVYEGKKIFSSPQTNDQEIVYIESWTDTKYLDSLIIQEKYNQGKGALVFSQEAMAVLLQQEADLENIKEEKLLISCQGVSQAGILLAYRMPPKWKIRNFPLYMTHLFLEKDPHTLMLWSHSTEDKKEQDRIRSSLQKIWCP